MQAGATSRRSRRMRLLLVALLLSQNPFDARAQERPPNVVLMLIDDLGATDLGCYGSRYYETPNIDQLAKDGMRFTQAYSACTVCSPTRAALLTGKAPARLHITDYIPGHRRPHARLQIPRWTQYLPLAEETLAERLKTKGYATASIGKWHLGGPEFYPEKHGFDVNAGGTSGGAPPRYFAPYGIETLPDGPKDEFLTDRLTNEAIKFIEGHKEEPFFIYLPHYAVHTPIMGKPDAVARYQAKRADGGHGNPVYAALVESVDESVARLRAALKSQGLDGNTVFVFTSDNGGLSGTVGEQGWKRGPTDNSPFRGGKGGAYDGGVRVPLIVAWPGVVEAGSQCDEPVISYDLTPTLLAATGTPRAAGQVVDGQSLMPLLTQQGQLQRDAIFWHYPHYHPGSATPCSAIREGDWKLIEFYEDGRVELYNLRRDPGEMQNMADVDADVAQRLRDKLHGWLKEVGAQWPEPNQEFDPEKAWEREPRVKK